MTLTLAEPPITVDQMRSKLHPLDHVREALARTEPLATYAFSVGNDVRFRVEPGWHHGIDAKQGADLVDVYLHIGSGSVGSQFQLTKDSVLEATSLCGLSKGYAARCPAELVEPHLNYWFREGLAGRPIRDFQLLVAGDSGAAITRASIQPFSNVRLLEQAVAGIEAKFGAGEILVDYKFTHTLRQTHVRLIVPERCRVIERTGTDADAWSLGVQFNNSLIGAGSTSISGYLFRWFCTNGATDTMATSGVYSRRGAGREQEVYEWARGAVDDVLGGLEPALDNVQAMVDIPIEGEANNVLRDVFQHYRTPLPERARIIERMVEAGQLTMYSVMAAITEVANDTTMHPSHVDGLLRMGGDLPHAATSRCTACRRLLPH
jgi:hypothetical protein